MKAVLQVLNFDNQTTINRVKHLLRDINGITDVRMEELTGRIILNTKSYNSLEGAKTILADSGVQIVEVKKKISSRHSRKKSED